LMLSLVMVGMLSAPEDAQAIDKNLILPILFSTAIVGVGATLIYNSIDSNVTLLQKADEYLKNVDTCQDLLPPSTWHGTTESYFEQYVQRTFGVLVTDMHKGSYCTHDIVNTYISKMKSNLYAARQCVEFRSRFYTEMSYKLSEIQYLENLLARADGNATYYNEFLLGHQILNFHMNLPTRNVAWITNTTQQEQQATLVKCIRRGFFSNSPYPLMSYQEQISKDLKFIRQYLASNGRCFMHAYPQLYTQLMVFQDVLEATSDILLDCSAYQIEKDNKHKEDLLLVEQAKARAQQEAARAQQASADAQLQQAWAQQNQAWAQHRKANAQEEANNIAKNNKK
jgi:hypothetical protein